MNHDALVKAVISATKTANSRIRRLKQSDLPNPVIERIETAQKMKSEFITGSGFVSSSTAGYTDKQLKQKLDWIRGISKQIGTVADARSRVEKYAKENEVDTETAKQRLKVGKVFAQILNEFPSVFDSTNVNETITEFAKTPTFKELEEALFSKYARDLQDFTDTREDVRAWIEKTGIIPDGVDGKFIDGVFKFNDEIDDTEADTEV